MTELERAHEASQAVQFCLAEAMIKEKRLTLNETFNLLSAAMVVQDYLKKRREAARA